MINLWVSKYRGDTFIGTSLVNYGTVEVFTKKSCETRPGDGKNSQKSLRLNDLRFHWLKDDFSENCDFSRKNHEKIENFKISKTFAEHLYYTPVPRNRCIRCQNHRKLTRKCHKKIVYRVQRSKNQPKNDFSSKNQKM